MTEREFWIAAGLVLVLELGAAITWSITEAICVWIFL